ncbi:MAG TPA: retropepsin-like aspartic protease [Methylomirabilota bacterium]|jgi:predicted aspartyl protease|nr:retropepsin-like aspartic protease [Methylomirabilota bacterium]
MRRAALVGFSLSLLLAVAPGAHAQFFRYSDDTGQNHYVDGLDKIPERYRNAAVPLSLRNAPAATPASTAGPAVARPAGTTVIKYTPGQRIMVDVKINGAFTAQLLLDTGADRTMISPRTLQAAGVAITRPVATGSITGVTGSDRMSYVVVDSLEVGEARVGKMPVGSYELAGTGTGDGLLGRDFLDQFKMTVDAGKGEVHLSPK